MSREIHYVHSTQPLSVAAPVIAQWVRNKVAMVTATGVMADSATWTSNHQGQTNMANLSATETNTNFWHNTIPWDDKTATCWHVNSPYTSSTVMGQCLVLTGLDNFLWYTIAFPTHRASAQTTIHRVIQCLVHCPLVFHKAVPLIKKPHTKKRAALGTSS